MTTTLTHPDDDNECTSCAARAGSCEVQRWLSGRSCCDGCSHPAITAEATP